jgi:hypothetical protein
MFSVTLNIFHRGTSEYIPNDLVIGSSHGADSSTPEILLLSGPNMGGKSTLLRQTCLIVILAQLGCKVPADYCSLTPVDRIYTRIGATDKILSGQSTFFVELAETATILRSATQVFPGLFCLSTYSDVFFRIRYVFWMNWDVELQRLMELPLLIPLSIHSLKTFVVALCLQLITIL